MTLSDNKKRRVGKTTIETLQLGVYKVLIERQTSFVFDFSGTLETWRGAFKTLERLVKDVFDIAPIPIFIMAVVKLWNSLEEVVSLALEARLLKIIEVGLTSKDGLDSLAVLIAVLARISFGVCSSLINHWSRTTASHAENRVRHHYDDYLLTVQLRRDLPSLQDNRSDDHISSGLPWSTFKSMLDLSTKLFAVATQLAFMSKMQSGSWHCMIFAFLCIGKPLIQPFVQMDMWSMPHIVQANNQDYLRIKSLKALENKHFRADILSGNLVQYIINEFRKARATLGDTCTDTPEYQYENNQPPITRILSGMVQDFPLIYYAAATLIDPKSMSVSTIASLQQSATVLRWQFWEISYNLERIRQSVSRIQDMFELENKAQAMRDGDLPYPSEKVSIKGMGFELRNVTFSYPGSKEGVKALNDVSFSINPGELLVIVGANGSGKSTFVKLLTRLYDVDTGSIIVDGEDIRRYKQADLRKTMATLTQDHHLFPLSIEENIGLGHAEAIHDKDLIMKSAKMGGATDILNKLNEGVKTILDPCSTQYSMNVEEDEETELATALKKLEKKIEVSGGERQRLVASRTFMRFSSDQIKFVAVDEPSSALDPEGELELFNNLREAREHKTMIFVTHRFGHLTKHADKILCMKEGKVEEFGTHFELMAKGGEYSKMYRIQADAFESISAH